MKKIEQKELTREIQQRIDLDDEHEVRWPIEWYQRQEEENRKLCPKTPFVYPD